MAGETEILDERFRSMTLGNAWLEKLHGGMLWAEGPVYFADGDYLLWSDIPNNRMMQWSEGLGVRVFRLPPTSGSLAIVADDFVKPNGIAFSPDESILYIADTGGSHDPNGPHHIRAFAVRDGERLGEGRVFAEINPGLADGFRLASDGNLWTSAGDGVHCFSPAGELLGKIRVPEVVSNVAFGGPKRNRLFITATSSLYATYVAQAGAQRP